jgi:hypothetical protein
MADMRRASAPRAHFVYERPWLYPKQQAAIFDCKDVDGKPSRYAFIEASTKAGKTSACIAWLFEQAIKGKAGQNFWWIAPVYAQAKIAYRRMKLGLPKWLYKANEQDLTITILPLGQVIWFKTAEKPDNLYGDDVFAAVIDEASRAREEAWHAIRSTITATRGPVRCIGNVKGRKNWFYRLARQAEAGEPGMSHAKLNAWDAVAGGVLEKAEIEDARRLLPEHVFKELYLAEAAEDESNPFGLAHIRACTRPMSEAKAAAIGVDLAKSIDWTVVVGLDAEGVCCGFDRWQFKPWHETSSRILSLIGRTPTLADSTGVGDPIVEGLQQKRPGVVEGFTFTGPSKQKLMEGLAVAIQSQFVFFPPGPITAELENFEYVYTRNGVRYCLDPSTPVLTADLRWVRLGDLREGDEVLGFDEHPTTGKSRSWRRARVLATERITRPCYRIEMEDGTSFVASEDHLWLVDTGQGAAVWRTTASLRGRPKNASLNSVANRLLRVCDVWDAPSSFDAGYIAGVLDGEGSICQPDKSNGGHGLRVTFAQRDNEVAAGMRHRLAAMGFAFSEARHATHDVIGFGITGRRHEVLRLLGSTRPARLLAKFDPDKLGTLERKASVAVRSVEFIGDHEVVAMSTTTKTFVAAGFATHNCAPEGYHDDCVMALALAVEKLRQLAPGLRWSGTPIGIDKLDPWLGPEGGDDGEVTGDLM